jgi:hypothetical protein
VPEAIRLCRQAGIKVTMVTGDYGLTAEAIARQIGLLDPTEMAAGKAQGNHPGADPVRVIEGSDLSLISDVHLRRLIKYRTRLVFARMAPEQKLRLVVGHDPVAAARRTAKRCQQIQELIALGEEWGGRLDEQDAGKRRKGRPLSDSGAKARLYHAVKDARLAHLIKVDLHSELFSFTIDEERQRYLERLDGKLLVVTNTDAAAADVITRYKSLADIERGFRTLKSDIEIGPIYHRLPRRIRAHALVCFLALILHRVLRMRLKQARRAESPVRLLEQLRRVHQQTAATPGGHVVHGVTKLAAEQRDLFAAIGVPTPKPQELAEPASTVAL